MPLRHIRDVLDALRAQGADERLLRRLKAVAENRCSDPTACDRCEVRCLDGPQPPAPAPARGRP